MKAFAIAFALAVAVDAREAFLSMAYTNALGERFALVFRNPSDSRYFFAAPHTVHPAEHSLGFKFKCLCINHAFKSEPKGLWYRVVEFRLSRDFAGTQLVLTHTIIGIDKGQAAPFLKGPDQNDL